MIAGHDRVMLYRFFIKESGAYGQPFGLCAYHRDAWVSPVVLRGTHRIERVAETTEDICNQCWGALLGI